jgi:hypothetical protein
MSLFISVSFCLKIPVAAGRPICCAAQAAISPLLEGYELLDAGYRVIAHFFGDGSNDQFVLLFTDRLCIDHIFIIKIAGVVPICEILLKTGVYCFFWKFDGDRLSEARDAAGHDCASV